ncbi:ParB/RepB/Spo0J family partition protein [Streptomyces sp. NPDC008150]|uniref:ParB/RepB/Spo0J family partition protein n=1 Tax=Streptomyces sp. NPDC008150 TaxID=3364816 RepID=UPI0036EC7769
MSKADELRKSSSFGAAATALSSRRAAIEDAISGGQGGPAPTVLPVTLISENPDNPRNHMRNLEDFVETIRGVGVIQPITVGTVEAYLRERADRSDDLDRGAQYVVVDGHRRLEASRRLGLATIPVYVDDRRLTDDETLLEAAFIANYHRDDMTDLEEAHAIQQLVEHYGSQTKVAKKLGIPQATISSKLSLLKLSPQLQKDLQTGARSVEHVRNLGKLSPDEQKAKADQRAAAARSDKTGDSPASEAAPDRSSGPANYHAVIITEAPQQPEPEALVPTAEPASRTAETGQQAPPESPAAIPDPRGQAAPSGSEELKGLKRFPYEDSTGATLLLTGKMPRDVLVETFRGIGAFLGVDVPAAK